MESLAEGYDIDLIGTIESCGVIWDVRSKIEENIQQYYLSSIENDLVQEILDDADITSVKEIDKKQEIVDFLSLENYVRQNRDQCTEKVINYVDYVSDKGTDVGNGRKKTFWAEMPPCNPGFCNGLLPSDCHL